MYSKKEKNIIYNALKNLDHGEADLQLLTKVWPTHLLTKKAQRDPKRYAHEVLYALLDKVSREDIRNNRREHKSLKEKENETPDSTGGHVTGTGENGSIKSDEDIEPSGTKSDDETTAAGSDELPSETSPTEQKKEVADQQEKTEADTVSKEADTKIVEQFQEVLTQKEQELEQAEEQVEQVESEKEELQEELDEERKAHEETQAALEEEKKSPETIAPEPEAPKSRRRTSTKTSTGETLPTETSK